MEEAAMTAASSVTTDVRTDEGVLVGPEWLEAHLADPAVRVVEVDVSRGAYDAGHIDGAVLWDLYQDVKDSEYRTVDEAALRRLIERSGISPASTVVFYGYAPAMGFWIMKLFGHRDVRILDVARTTWRDAGRPWSDTVDQPAVGRYPLPAPDGRIRIDQSELAAAIDDPARVILDVRTGLEFSGERFWPSGGIPEGARAGHVPSARFLPLEGLYGDDGAFRSPDELARRFAPADVPGTPELITYCTIGARASTAWFVLTQLLGRADVRVYDGSWAEWGRQPGNPVAGGAPAQER
jgi:thiosulfate/3-mercaptopyruvate sulfurtransferase